MPPSPTFWLLDGRTGWRTATARDVTVGVDSGIRLSAHPDGPLNPVAGDGSLGGATLPRHLALDPESTLHLLDRAALRVRRFDPATGRFPALPTVGGRGRESRQFRNPTSIAIAGHRLYVADSGNHRVAVFSLTSLGLLHLFGPWIWRPIDVTAAGALAWILDERHSRLWRHRVGADELELAARPPDGRRWRRVAADGDGNVYLVHSSDGVAAADLLDPDGRLRPIDVGELADRLGPPPVRVDWRGRFFLPAELARPCDRRPPATAPPPEAPLLPCRPGAGGLLFDDRGRPTTLTEGEAPGPARYRSSGRWISQALDSGEHRCQWHRIELELADLPAGTQVVVSTYTDDQQRAPADIQWLPEDLWVTRHRVVAPDRPPGSPAGLDQEFLVQSREGRYLWLRLELRGDGYASPAVRSIRVHFPRRSYLQYLPAVFAGNDDSRWFLERFLSVFQSEWEALEDEIDQMERQFDPDAVPAGPRLDELARWLALPLEGDWSADQRRRLLAAAPSISPRRGTPDGLRRHVRVYLENLTGRTLPEGDWPRLVEGFRERDRLILARARSAELGRGAPLWSPSVVGRLQLGAFAREGEARLVSTRDPQRDLFHQFAHRFKVFVPAGWVRTAEQERLLRRAIEAEKPAHTAYDLCLVRPRFRVGVQSTVGIDTIVAGIPLARLACRHRHDPAPDPPPTRHRLGLDTVLACRPGGRDLRVGVGLHVGPGAKLS